MFEKMKTMVNTPEFKTKAVQAAGGVVSFVATVIIANLVGAAVNAGVEAIVAKINETPVA